MNQDKYLIVVALHCHGHSKLNCQNIVTQKVFMKNLFQLKNYPVECHNISVKHDLTIDERVKGNINFTKSRWKGKR